MAFQHMNQTLHCTIIFEPANLVASLDGDLDSYSAENLFAQLSAIIKAGSDLVVDLSALSFIDTAGLAVLDRIAQCLAEKGGSLRLADPSAPVRRLLSVTGLADRFTVQTGRALESSAPPLSPSGDPATYPPRSRPPR